jgi:hypothetical protein
MCDKDNEKLVALQLSGVCPLLRSIEDRMVLSWKLAVDNRWAVHPGLGLLRPPVHEKRMKMSWARAALSIADEAWGPWHQQSKFLAASPVAHFCIDADT